MTPVEFILTFAIGGVTLRGVIAWAKKVTKATGFLALLLSLGVCAAASAAYIFVAPYLGLESVSWDQFLFLACEVFVGTQVVYRATK